VIAKDTGTTVSDRVVENVRAGLLESVTVNVIGVLLTVAVGRPDTTPLDATSDNPAGSDPREIAQLYGATPPVAASVAL
jgi:hypothetical protein